MFTKPLPWLRILSAGAIVLLGSIIVRSVGMEMTGFIGLLLIIIATLVVVRLVPER